MKHLLVMMLSLFFVFSLLACGGGDDNDDNDSATTGTITGSVSGTTVIAVNEDGDIVASDNTAGREYDLDLDSDGANDAFSFTLTGIPVDLGVRIYLVTGDGCFPVYFDDDGSDANVFSLSSGTDIDFGYISVDIGAGVAHPANNPLDNSDVVSGGLDTDIVISGATIDDFAGTWQGTLAYTIGNQGDSSYESGDVDATLTLSVSGDSLVGTFVDEEDGVYIEGTEADGYFNFDLPAFEPENSDCDDWDVSLTAILDASLTEMELNGSGTFCGDGAGKPGTFKGTLFKATEIDYDFSGEWVFTGFYKYTYATEYELFDEDRLSTNSECSMVMAADGAYPTIDIYDCDEDGDTDEDCEFYITGVGECSVSLDADNTGGSISSIHYDYNVLFPDEDYGNAVDYVTIEEDEITIYVGGMPMFTGILDGDAGTITNGTFSYGDVTYTFTGTRVSTTSD